MDVVFRRAICPKCGANLESGRFTEEGFEPIEALRCPACRYVMLLSSSGAGLSPEFAEAVIQSIHDEIRKDRGWMGSIELLKGLLPHLSPSRIIKIQNTLLDQFGLVEHVDKGIDTIDILFNADRNLPPEDLPAYVRSQIP